MVAEDTAEIVSRSTAGVSYLWLGTLMQRLLTFGLNAALLRFTTADVVGFASNDMELLLSTIMFLSRESCRMVALRTSSDAFQQPAGSAARQLVNLAWLPVLPGLLAAGTAASWLWRLEPDAKASVSGERVAAVVYCVAAAVELLSEPFFILTQARLLYAARAGTEIAASILKCVVTFLLVVFAGQAALAFALGQLTYAVCLWFGYFYHARAMAAGLAKGPSSVGPMDNLGSAGKQAAYSKDKAAASTSGPLSLLPSSLPSQSNGPWAWLQAQLGQPSFSLLLGFSGQTFVKHVLTELDRLLLTGLAARSDRGAYAVAANYGGLAARLLFQPIEEALRGFISKMIGPEVAGTQEKAGTDTNGSKTSSSGPRLAAAVFLLVFRGVILVGSLVAIFGHYCSGSVVKLALGKWADTEVPTLLGAYSVYVLCMALNGVSEAFVAATADTRRLTTGNVHMTAAALACTGTAMWALPRYGTVSLIWINCANMLLRTMSSCSYIASVLERVSGPRGPTLTLRTALPSQVTLAVLTGAVGVLYGARARLPAAAEHLPVFSRPHLQYLAVGLACGVACFGAIVAMEGRDIREAYRMLKGRQAVSASLPAAIKEGTVDHGVPAVATASIADGAGADEAEGDSPVVTRKSPRGIKQRA